MLSLIQAEEIKSAVVESLKATYNFDDKKLEQAFEDFLYNKRTGMFKGPYIQIHLPFEQVDKDLNLDDVLTIQPGFKPYLHQYEAFKRLSTRNNDPKPVILTTGTGSGKTTVVNEVMRQFPQNDVVLLSQDNYYNNSSHLSEAEKKKINFDIF